MADLLALYRQMARARALELAVADLWQQGLIAGEMHLGTGEEALIVGVLGELRDGDAVAVDHRATPVFAALGVDLVALLKEMLGREDGLCRGRGGHMHLFAPDRLAASSGIVGAAGPLGAGFALAAKTLRPGAVAVAFFGDGAANQGMLLESLNLAVAWSLPLVFVCKDNGWAVTTRSSQVTGGDLEQRAASFGMPAESIDGLELEAVSAAAARAVERARQRRGPSFIRGRCLRADGHFLGDPMVRTAQRPIAEGGALFGKVVRAAVSAKGGGLAARAGTVVGMVDQLRRARQGRRDDRHDPLQRARRGLRRQREQLELVDRQVAEEVAAAVAHALEEASR